MAFAGKEYYIIFFGHSDYFFYRFFSVGYFKIGTQVNLEKTLRVLLIVTGVKSAQILGHGETIESMKHREIEEELGIEFFE